MTQLQIERLAKQYANAMDLMGRGKVTGYSRMDKISARMEALPLGQQLAVSTIAQRIINDD